MSYGRKPYYIWSDGKHVHFWGPDVKDEPSGMSIPEDALAQYIHSMATFYPAEFEELLQRGAELRPDVGRRVDIAVTPRPGFPKEL